MGTAEQGYSRLGKGLNPYKMPPAPDAPATTEQIEQQKRDVETGRGKGAEPLKGTTTAKVTK